LFSAPNLLFAASKVIIGFHPPAFTEEPNVISPLYTERPKLNLIATELRNHPNTLNETQSPEQIEEGWGKIWLKVEVADMLPLEFFVP